MTRKDESVSLPAPATDGVVAVERALQKRRSIRDFSDAPLTLGIGGGYILSIIPSGMRSLLLASGDKRGPLAAAAHAQEWVADAAAVCLFTA
jgi:hypothetical protein